MISLNAYQSLADAWQAGVADWCRAASGFRLEGGRAWMLSASEGQANWIKRRLLCEGTSLFGIQFVDARALRRELCLRLGMEAPTLGRETLDFLLRARALGSDDPEAAAVARHPGACLGALDDLAAAGWLDHPAPPGEWMPAFVRDWLPALRGTGFWTPHIDRQLRRGSLHGPPPDSQPLAVCVLGWDASRWPLFDLLLAALHAAHHARVYLPQPRGTSEDLQHAWLTGIETELGVEVNYCPSSDFHSGQAVLLGRLEGTDLDKGATEKPEFLAGSTWADTILLARDFIARWLLTNKEDTRAVPPGDDEDDNDDEERCESARLAILCPRRTASAVALVRALGEAGIAVEDELGEVPEPSLAIQIERAVLDYHLNAAGLSSLLALIGLLNEHCAHWSGNGARVLRAICPLDPVEVRRALRGAFADFQHHDSRVLCEADSFVRAPVARPLRELVTHLGTWPETLEWADALQRWERCLDGLGLSAEALEPFWSRIRTLLPVAEPVPSSAFFHYLGSIVGCIPARRAPEGSHRFARVVITTLAGAAGQIWGGALFLDSNEGAWPLYPSENPFLDDAERARLNERRSENTPDGACPNCGHLLTSSQRAQLEQFQFFEILENCSGPLAFAGAAHDPTEPNKELYPNEWALRCLVESERSENGGGEKNLLDLWRSSVRQVRREPPAMPKGEREHLQSVFAGRRNPEAPFDGYCFNFEALTAPDELPWADAWSARDLDSAWNRPATFALEQIFAAEPWRDGGRGLTRAEDWAIGRLVHRWVGAALGASKEPRQFGPEDWRRALGSGLEQARQQSETKLRSTLGGEGAALSLWWQGVMRKATWATRRCLETLAEFAAEDELKDGGTASRWVCLDQTLRSELKTSFGPLRLQAHCDLMLLDRAEMQGAACQIVDIKTGSQPSAAPASLAQMEQGRGLGLAALLSLALSHGVEPEKVRVGVVHPEAANASLLGGGAASALGPVLDRIARKQRTLSFGQRGLLAGKFGQNQGENLPLATTPIDPDILMAKAERTDG